MGLKDEFEKTVENQRDATGAQGERAQADGSPGVPTPDQTRHDGMIPDPGLSHADTSGLIEDRKREGNLEGM